MALTRRAMTGDGKLRKRDTILRAAVEVIAERGYFGARMAEVAERAQVADGTLYLYFKGKEDLLVSIFEDYVEAFLRLARRDLAGVSDARRKLALVVERHLASLERDRPLAHVLQIELRHTRRFLRRVAKGRVADYLALLEEIVREGVHQGVFRADVPPEVAARAVFGSLDESVTAWVLAKRPGSLSAQARPLLDLLLQGLEPPQPRPAPDRPGVDLEAPPGRTK
jgi:TetR/AcrR family transcriptional regulator, fatty acid metabolism regulator protein